jgi:group I intron endonuclease
MGFIYLIKNKINEKCYVGQTRMKRIEARWGSHRRPSKNNKTCIANAVRLYGWNSFEPSVICEIPNEDLDLRESLEIRERNTIAPNGYNLASGGGVNRIVHPETRVKLSKGRVGKKHTEETKAIIGAAHKGELSSNYGIVYSKERREKMSERGRTIGADHLRVKKEERHMKKVNQYTLDGVFVKTHESSMKAAESINVTKSTMSSCCLGKSQTSGGFIWQYADDNHVINQYTLDGKFVHSFKSSRSAAVSTGSSIPGVHACLKGTRNTTNGFIWKRELLVRELNL